MKYLIDSLIWLKPVFGLQHWCIISFFLATSNSLLAVCAKVSVELDQTAVITRSAIRASLKLSDNDATSPVSKIRVAINVDDAKGQSALDRFSVQVTSLQGISDVDGTGSIQPQSSATIVWLLIPTDQAATDGPTVYSVSGHLSYDVPGEHLEIPLAPVKITVYPDAALDLLYFYQRNVFSDDPFTPEIEPAEPYAVALMVKNSGQGAAQDLRISSAQPRIVSNDKGLLIDFKLLSTVLDGTNVPNDLSLDFGSVEPGAIRIAEWWFTSPLQGHFEDFSATFRHLDSLGNPHLSTIKNVTVHELAHIVDAGYQFEDGKPDFFVNDVADPDNLPDTLYLSDGRVSPVQELHQYTLDSAPSAGNLRVQLTTATQSGWVYLHIPEPSDGQLILNSVVRSDGGVISVGTNAWTTDRTFRSQGQPPVYENILHLLDYDSPGIYTLYYSVPAPAPVDNIAPSSSIKGLSALSQSSIPVQWSGQDNPGGSGIASFDIFVSIDGAAFALWLEKSTLNGVIYTGIPGKSYAFYSVATDKAGNRELAHSKADATTHVNMPPVAGTMEMGCDQDSQANTRVAKLLTHASDSDGGTLSLDSVESQSQQGGSVARQGDIVVYSPPSGFAGKDAFHYTVSDGQGGTATGTVNVTVTGNNSESPNISSIQPNGDKIVITFYGIPGLTYGIEATPTLTNPHWMRVGSAKAGPTGMYQFQFTTGGTSQYYRGVYP